MKKVLTGLLVTACFSQLPAQELVPMTLNEALATAAKNNKEIVMASMDEQRASAEFKQMNAVFLPEISVSYTAISTNNPLNAFGFKLQQESITSSDFNPDLLNNPSTASNFMTKAEWLQPIINLDLLSMRKAAGEQRTVYSFKAMRTREYVAFEVQKAYAQLQLAWQAKQVSAEALQTANSIYAATNNRFEKGLLQKSDLLTAQVQVAAIESNVAESANQVLNASDYLSLLMGVKTGTVYQVDPISPAIVVDVIVTEVPTTRADFQAMQSAVSAQEAIINSGRMSYLPKLNGFVDFMINDNDAFGFASNSYLAGLQLSWTLFNGTATHHKIEQKRVERNKTIEQLNYQKEQSQLELNKALRQKEDALAKLKQYETSVTQASEALRILENRYQQGLVSTNDVLQSQTLLTQQKFNYAQAVFTLIVTQAYLQFLTSTIK